MHILLYIIAFLEGFTTLSVEIMAIRNSVSIIGSNAIATSVILWVILLALSYGYYRWGIYAAEHKHQKIKEKIYWNLIIASVFYTFVAFPFENFLLNLFLSWDIGYFIPILLVTILLFFLPVFLASQTIPLLSELIDDEQKSVVIGKLLFYSTIGSFTGSVVTSLVFFSTIGVERSIIVNGIILAVLAFAIIAQYEKRYIKQNILFLHGCYLVILVSLLFVDFGKMLRPYVAYSQSTEYNDIRIYDHGDTRLFTMNGSHSSGLDITTGKSYFSYIQETTRLIDIVKPKKILVIGAAGFTLPQDIATRDFVEQVDVCDIDGALAQIAEEHFLGEKLHPKIHFYPESARYFLNKKIKEGETYDFILLDAYNGKISIPSELLTKDFFESIRKISSGTIAMNLILDSTRTSHFSQKLANTLNSSLGEISIASANILGSAWVFDNFIAVNRFFPRYKPFRGDPLLWIYTDNLNTLEKDKYDLFYTNQMN